MMMLYRLAVFLGLVPLGALTVITVTGLTSDHIASVGTATIPDVAGLAKKLISTADGDRSLLLELAKSTATPYDKTHLAVDPNPGQPAQAAATWKTYENARELARDISSGVLDREEPPVVQEIPGAVRSLDEMKSQVSAFDRGLRDATSWLDQWSPRRNALASLKERIKAERNRGLLVTQELDTVVTDRIRQLDDDIRMLTSKQTGLTRAREGFQRTIVSYELADEYFRAEDYEQSYEKIRECRDPKPPEVESLVVRADFWRRSAPLMVQHREVLRSSGQHNLNRLMGDIENVLRDFTNLKKEDYGQRDDLFGASATLRALADIDQIENETDLSNWVRQARRVKETLLSGPSRDNEKNHVTKELSERLRARFQDQEVGRKTPVGVDGLQEAITSASRVKIGVFEPWGVGNAYKYWNGPQVRNTNPNGYVSFTKDALREGPRAPLAITLADEYNTARSELISRLSSREQWGSFERTCQELKRRLDEYVRMGGDRAGITFQDEIRAANSVVESWSDIQFVANPKSRLYTRERAASL